MRLNICAVFLGVAAHASGIGISIKSKNNDCHRQNSKQVFHVAPLVSVHVKGSVFAGIIVVYFNLNRTSIPGYVRDIPSAVIAC